MTAATKLKDSVLKKQTLPTKVCIVKAMAFQVALVVKNLPASAGDPRYLGSIPGSVRSAGGGHGNPLRYSSLENPLDRGAWWAMVHRIVKSQT